MSLPYAQILQDYLWGQKELKLRKISLPGFYIPENLFLKRYKKEPEKFSRNLQS